MFKIGMHTPPKEPESSGGVCMILTLKFRDPFS